MDYAFIIRIIEDLKLDEIIENWLLFFIKKESFMVTLLDLEEAFEPLELS